MGVQPPEEITRWTPLVCSLQYLANTLSVGIKLKNFELVSLVCMALKTSSIDANATLSNRMPNILRHSVHICAQLETVLITSQLLSQALLINGHVFSDSSETWDSVHWRFFDSQLFHAILPLAKTGSGPDKMIPNALLPDFFTIWNQLNDLESIEIVIEYDFEKDQQEAAQNLLNGKVNGGGPLRRKKKKGTGKKLSSSTSPLASPNIFAVLSDA
jgi:hypothetical protein